jgi:hypothetical protein
MYGEGDILVPLVDSVVVYENRLDLHGAEKDLVYGRTVVDIESDDGDFGSDIAGRRKCEKQTRSVSRDETHKET